MMVGRAEEPEDEEEEEETKISNMYFAQLEGMISKKLVPLIAF